MVSLIGDQGFDMFLAPLSPAPARVEVKIPKAACCGDHHFTAVGMRPGDPTSSLPLSIDVEPVDLPTKLKPLIDAGFFRSPSGSLPLRPQAVFPDGTESDVVYSSRVTYTALDPQIASVDWQGVVTAKSPGKTSILITYTENSRKVHVAVPIVVNAGPIASSAYTLKFPEQPVGTRSAEETITLKARTLGPVKILTLKANGDYAETDNCTPSAIPHGGTCTLWVTFTPRAPGERSGTIEISNDFSDGLTITLEGIGR